MVPMEPPTLTILVEARLEESVVTTRLRAMGNLNVTETQKRMATEIDTVGLHRGDRARGVDEASP